MHALEQTELRRYQRHFPVIGIEGQEQLKQAKVLCVGAGGLGCPALQYLAAAGVGMLGVMDADDIELSNLQRQILFTQDDVGRNKAVVIAERLHALNNCITVDVYSEFLSHDNAHHILQKYDLVLDATDNYEARYLLNDICRVLSKPLVSASIYQFDAQLSVFNYKHGPCYQCLYPEPPPAALTPNCAVGGVLGVLPGVAGTIQATEAIKVILGLGDVLSGTLLSMDLLSMRFNQFEIAKQDCSKHPRVEFNLKADTSSLLETLDALELSKLLADSECNIQLIDVREPYERTMCHIGGEHLPLSSLPTQYAQLDKAKPIVVYCKAGKRGETAGHILQDVGFTNVKNLAGGILSWIDTVDASLMRY